jgi:hypothetical protein
MQRQIWGYKVRGYTRRRLNIDVLDNLFKDGCQPYASAVFTPRKIPDTHSC